MKLSQRVYPFENDEQKCYGNVGSNELLPHASLRHVTKNRRMFRLTKDILETSNAKQNAIQLQYLISQINKKLGTNYQPDAPDSAQKFVGSMIQYFGYKGYECTYKVNNNTQFRNVNQISLQRQILFWATSFAK